MFGITPFSQVPFSSLGSAATIAYLATLTEDIGLTDTNTQLSTFLQVVAENFIAEDFNSEASIFFEGIVETLSNSDSSTQLSAFGQVRAEDLGLNDAQSISMVFSQSLVESIVIVQDVPTPYFASLQTRVGLCWHSCTKLLMKM
jgi:hypothetical protein